VTPFLSEHHSVLSATSPAAEATRCIAVHSHIVNIQWRSDGGAGRTGRHLLGAAKGRKTPKI